MYWNYRIILHKGVKICWDKNKNFPDTLAIHEVYYDEKGEPTSWTENPIDISGQENIPDIEHLLDTIREALNKPILEIDKKTETLKEINKERQNDLSKSPETEE